MKRYVSHYGSPYQVLDPENFTKSLAQHFGATSPDNPLSIAAPGALWYEMISSELLAAIGENAQGNNLHSLRDSVQQIIVTGLIRLKQPSAVENLDFTPRVQGFSLAWTASHSADVNGYLVEWRTRLSENENWSAWNFTETDLQFISIPTLEKPEGLPPQAFVEIRVSAWRQYRENYPKNYSAPSGVFTRILPGELADTSVPDAPTDVTISRGTFGKVFINWTNPDNSNFYYTRIISNNPNVAASIVYGDPGTTQSYTYYGLAEGFEYEFELQAVNDHNLASEKVVTESITTDNTPPGAPSNLVISSTRHSLKLSWTAPSDDDLEGFRVLVLGAGIQLDLPLSARDVEFKAYSKRPELRAAYTIVKSNVSGQDGFNKAWSNDPGTATRTDAGVEFGTAGQALFHRSSS